MLGILPGTSSTLLAVKVASVNRGEVTLPLLSTPSGWGELRGSEGAFRQLLDAVAGPLGFRLVPAEAAGPVRKIRYIVAPAANQGRRK